MVEDKLPDVIILGSGPAGVTAALYAARAKRSTLVIAGSHYGGQLMITQEVENYPGFLDGILGPELMEGMIDQAKKFGAQFLNEDVSWVNFKIRPFEVIAGEKKFATKAIIIATGASVKWLEVPGEGKLKGKGVSSCAPCDAPFFKDKIAVVVGGGDAAMEEALYLTKFAKSVTIIHRRGKLRASKIMQDRAFANPKISFVWDSQVEEILGEERVKGVKIQNLKTGETEEIPCDAVFVAIGQLPNTEIFKNQIELDAKGYIKIIQAPKFQMKNEKGEIIGNKFSTMTSVEGIFAAGDVVDFHYRQAVTAAASGCMAAMDAEKYLEEKAS
jgi:thioredoxin reductase (NADPH)